MSRRTYRIRLGILFALWLAPVAAQPLSVERLEIHNVKAQPVTYKGRAAVEVTDAAQFAGDDTSRIAIIQGTALKDGTIEMALTGDTVPNAPPTFRGFTGVAFRVAGSGSQYECFYLRPKNGRAADQVQRSHATQYISVPGFPWQKLRSEHPGEYESYADLVPGEWTPVKIEVSGSTARLYVNGAVKPVLVVKDLKQTPVEGAVALWVGPGTIAHFADLKVSPQK